MIASVVVRRILHFTQYLDITGEHTGLVQTAAFARSRGEHNLNVFSQVVRYQACEKAP